MPEISADYVSASDAYICGLHSQYSFSNDNLWLVLYYGFVIWGYGAGVSGHNL